MAKQVLELLKRLWCTFTEMGSIFHGPTLHHVGFQEQESNEWKGGNVDSALAKRTKFKWLIVSKYAFPVHSL